jgi:hypothetical protein
LQHHSHCTALLTGNTWHTCEMMHYVCQTSSNGRRHCDATDKSVADLPSPCIVWCCIIQGSLPHQVSHTPNGLSRGSHPPTYICSRLLGPCFKTGRRMSWSVVIGFPSEHNARHAFGCSLIQFRHKGDQEHQPRIPLHYTAQNSEASTPDVHCKGPAGMAP